MNSKEETLSYYKSEADAKSTGKALKVFELGHILKVIRGTLALSIPSSQVLMYTEIPPSLYLCFLHCASIIRFILWITTPSRSSSKGQRKQLYSYVLTGATMTLIQMMLVI